MSFSINLLDEYGRIIQPQKMIEKTSKEVPRFIAHAGGEIEGYIYTNSLEAMNLSYSNGSRLFELDICETSDSVFVATHDWDTWQLQTNFQGILPPTLAEYNSYKIFGKFSPIDMNAINSWFQSHPDAILVSDKVNEPKRFSDVFIDKSRLMMELFSLDAVKEGLTCGILSAMPSENVIYEINADIDLLANLGVKNIAVSRWLIEQSIEWFKALKLKNIEPYIYHVFDASLEVSNNMRHIYGLYADKWELLNK
jgi:glycerophosphoryl diester phosphodiesterase